MERERVMASNESLCNSFSSHLVVSSASTYNSFSGKKRRLTERSEMRKGKRNGHSKTGSTRERP